MDDPLPAKLISLLLFKGALTTFINEHSGYIIGILICLIFSAIFSGYEAAFFSLDPKVSESIQANPKNSWQKHYIFLQHRPQRFIATILIANNAVNVSVVILSALILDGLQVLFELPGFIWTLIDLVLITSVLLMFGEITPKVYASNDQMTFLRLFSGVIRLFYIIFSPFSWILARLSSKLHTPAKPVDQNLTARDLKHAIELTSDEESPPEEKQILKGLVNLGNTPVRAITRARVDIKALPISYNNEQTLAFIRKCGYSRLPVYEQSLDNIKGILIVKDILPIQNDPTIDWHNHIRKATFYPESTKLNVLLKHFKENRLHMAVIVDEYGGTTGIVTLQDILDEIFGEMSDDLMREELVYSVISETEYVFDGKMPLLDVCRIVDLEDNTFASVRGDNDTIGGLLVEMLGRFPEKNDVVRWEQFEFTVESVVKYAVRRVKLRLLTEAKQQVD